jgi:hypothetical protein
MTQIGFDGCSTWLATAGPKAGPDEERGDAKISRASDPSRLIFTSPLSSSRRCAPLASQTLHPLITLGSVS